MFKSCLYLYSPPDGSVPEQHSDLGPEQQRVLLALVGQLLDQGSVHEASRVCRYFGLFHRDVWLVLRCRALASGEIGPEESLEEEAARPRVPSCEDHTPTTSTNTHDMNSSIFHPHFRHSDSPSKKICPWNQFFRPEFQPCLFLTCLCLDDFFFHCIRLLQQSLLSLRSRLLQ